MTLRNKLLVYAVFLAILPLGIAGRTMIRISEDELKSSANGEIFITAEQLAKDLDALYSDTWLAPLQLVASGIDNPQLTPQAKVSLLEAGIRTIVDVAAGQISVEGASPALITKDTLTGTLRAAGLDASEVLLVPATDLEGVAPGSEAKVGETVQISETDSWLLTLVLPLEDIADRRAALAARIDLERLRAYLDQHPFRSVGTITLVDTQGRQILDPERQNLGERSIVAEATKLLQDGSRSVGVTRPYARPDGQRMLAAYAFPQELDWAVIVERDEASAYLAITRMSESLTLWVVIGISIAALSAIFFARRVSRPVENMAGVARAVGEGNLEIEAEVPKSRDEIGQLARRMNEMILGLRERDFIRETFGRYVTPEVAQKVLSDPAALHPGGDLKTITILMSDLRGFTSLSERLSPSEMVEILNSYLGLMAEIIDRHGGTVIEFIGDAVMAIFGAPQAHDDDPLRAVAAAAEMQIELVEFNRRFADRGIPDLLMGVGINTGTVIVGNIGSEKRMKYGIVGDAVNMASRAESFTIGGEILVSESTREAVGDLAVFRGPLEVQAKGKKTALKLFAVVAVEAPYDLEVPMEHEEAEEDLVAVDLPMACYRISGKEVATRPTSAYLKGLSPNQADAEVDGELPLLSDLKIVIGLANGEEIENLYAKVTSKGTGERPRYRLRWTSVLPAETESLERLRSAAREEAAGS